MAEQLVKEPVEGNLEPEETDLEEISQADKTVTEEKETESAAGTGKVPYTPDEMKSLDFDQIDTSRIPDEMQPFYKAMQASYGKKTMTLAEQRKELEREREAQTPKTYFEDPKKNDIFMDYLKSPVKVVSDINAEIAKLESDETIYDDEGRVDVKKQSANRRAIAYWNGIKDEFSLKRQEVIERRRKSEVDESRIASELGENALKIEEYALSLGFSREDFLSKPKVREAAKKAFNIANVPISVRAKELKEAPKKLATQGGSTVASKEDDLDKLSPSEFAARRNKEKFNASF